MPFVGFALGFILGAAVVLSAEGLVLYLVIFGLRRKAAAPPKPLREPSDLEAEQWLTSATRKKGIVWFLEHENIPNVSFDEPHTGGPKELSVKKGTVQVQPAKKYAKLKDRLLILSGPDGSQTTIKLLDYTVLSVSSSNLSSKKWAKRYPIKLERRTSTDNDGSNTCYLYVDSSWEKESWCKVLRIASSRDRKLISWYEQISKEFNHYLASFNAQFPSFLKPSALPRQTVEKAIRADGSSSYAKARIFLKKIARKASKSSFERENSVLSSTHDVRRTGEKLVTLNDVTTAEGSVKSSLDGKGSSISSEDLVQLGNKGLYTNMSDAICDDKFLGDEGTLCWNLLLLRLFFDAKRSAEINSSVKTLIQKMLSNMRTPSYIGGVTCANLDLGNLPPYIHKIRVLPMDLTEVWAVEVEIEYLGGLLLDIETRIEVCEPELQEKFINNSSETNFNEEASSLLEGIEYYSNQLNSTAVLADQSEKRDEGEIDYLKQSKSSNQLPVSKSKWKTILLTIAEQVSQVPLSLGIRIASLRGTLRFHIRPPPSDQLWFGFTAMPNIDWQLESSIGERKITNSHIGLLISNRFKAAVRDNLVLPNCENISIPWMLAEKDDWVPRKVAPFRWIKQDSLDSNGSGVDLTNSHGDRKTKPNGTKPGSVRLPDDKTEEVKDVVYVPKAPEVLVLNSVPSMQTQNGSSKSISSGSTIHDEPRSASSQPSSQSVTSDELMAPLLTQDSSSQGRLDYSRMLTVDEQPSISSEEDSKAKKAGARARMLGLGKKMGEKLEEKRRHIEERSRHIVEKMLDNSRS
ncbi:hypothetical protein KSP39_PZI009745 [Platanthera zijinensis]|uniref:SMP-LTD domain-containing protein n=1 Tax=Platanthera zijinensis TaxID=2320716 RepID=A0AAP0BKN4_9ASPA